MALPVVDFSQFLHGSPADRQSAARAIDAALQRVGFVRLSSHGVPQDRVDACFAWVCPRPPRRYRP
jgi:isopenicillin N synthase-like dioxygenase